MSSSSLLCLFADTVIFASLIWHRRRAPELAFYCLQLHKGADDFICLAGCARAQFEVRSCIWGAIQKNNNNLIALCIWEKQTDGRNEECGHAKMFNLPLSPATAVSDVPVHEYGRMSSLGESGEDSRRLLVGLILADRHRGFGLLMYAGNPSNSRGTAPAHNFAFLRCKDTFLPFTRGVARGGGSPGA